MNIPDLLGLVPLGWAASLKEYKSTGKVYFDVGITGPISASKSPDIHCKFGIREGTLKKDGATLPLEQISLEGNFQSLDFGEMRTSELSLTHVAGKVKGSSFNGSLLLQDLEDPMLKLKANATFDLNEVFGFLAIPTVKSAAGSGQLDILLESKLSYLGQKENIGKIKADGLASLQNGQLIYKDGSAFKDLELQLAFNPKTIEIPSCKGVFGESDFNISGKATNWEGWLLANDTLDLLAKFESTNLVWNKKGTGADTGTFAWPHHLSAKLDASVEKFVSGSFAAENIKGRIDLTPEKLELTKVKMTVCDGNFELSNMEVKAAEGKYIIAASMDIHRVDISKLFMAFDDFGQQTLTHKHLKGRMGAKKLELLAVLNEKFEAIPDKIYLRTDLEIEDGELNGFEPALTLSRFVDVSELQHLKFEKLSNQIEIKSSIIYIPQMNIKSNALNLKLQGTHSFDNFMDYHLELKLKQLILKNRRQRQGDAFGEYEEDTHKERGMTLYLGMKGKPSSIKISYDKREARKGLKHEAKEEKETIKELMIKEFGELKDRKLNPTDTSTEDKIIWDD